MLITFIIIVQPKDVRAVTVDSVSRRESEFRREPKGASALKGRRPARVQKLTTKNKKDLIKERRKA